MLVDEELEVSAFILVSSGKHLMFERILRAAGSQRSPRVLLPPQESRRVRPRGWVAPPQSAAHRRGSALPLPLPTRP